MISSDSCDCESQDFGSPLRMSCCKSGTCETLMKENAHLRAQIDDAVSITSKMEEIHEQNTELVSEIGELKKEKADLQHRLEISLQTNRELAMKVTDVKRDGSAQRGTVKSAMDQEIKRIKESSRAQIEDVYDQLEQSQQQLEQVNVENKLMKSKIERLVRAAERFFGKQLQDIDVVYSLLEEPLKPIAREEPKALPVAKCDDRKLKRMRTHLKSEIGRREQLEADLKRSQKETREAVAVMKRQGLEFDGRSAQMEDEREFGAERHRQEVSALNQRLEHAETEVAQFKKSLDACRKKCSELAIQQTVQATQEIPEVQPIALIAKREVQAFEDCKRRCRDQNPEIERALECQAETKREILDVRKEKDALVKKVFELQGSEHELKLTVDRMGHSFSDLEVVHKQAVAEIETLRRALYAKENIKEEVVVKTPSPRVVKLKMELGKQRQRVFELEHTNNKYQTQIQLRDEQIRELENAGHALEDDLKKAREEVSMVYTPPAPTTDELLPPETFCFPEFDSKLSGVLSEIADNGSLQPSSKLQSAVRAVAGHFTALVEGRNQALDDAYSQNIALRTVVERFLVSASIALMDHAVPFREFYEGNAGTEFVKAVAALRTRCDELQYNSGVYENILTCFAQTFSDCVAAGAEPLEQITTARKHLDKITSESQTRAKKIRKLRASMKTERAKVKEAAERDGSEIEDLKESLALAICERDSAQEGVDKMRKRCEALKSQANNANTELVNKECAMVEDHEHQIIDIVKNGEQRENKLRDEIQEHAQKINELTMVRESDEKQIARLRNVVNGLRAAKQRRDIEYDELQAGSLEATKLRAEQYEHEKSEIIEAHAKIVAGFEQNCAKHMEDIEALWEKLSNAENSTTSAKATGAKLQRELEKAKIEIGCLMEQLHREKTLAETNVRASKMVAESHYRMKLEEQREQSDIYIRKLYAIASNAFRDFFDSREQMSERAFRTLINKARDELGRLTQSDSAIRSLLSATERQTTEDAVAQLAMGS